MFPEVPTVKEQGINFTMGMWRGLAAPKGTPPEVIRTLHDAFKKAMDDPDFQDRRRTCPSSCPMSGPWSSGR